MVQEPIKENSKLVFMLKTTLNDKRVMEQVRKLTSNKNFSNFLTYGMVEVYNESLNWEFSTVKSKKLLIGQNGFAQCFFNYENNGETPDSFIGVGLVAVPLMLAGSYVIEHSPSILGKIGGGVLCSLGGLVGLSYLEEEKKRWHSNYKDINCEEAPIEFPSLTSERYKTELELVLEETNKNFENYKRYKVHPNDNAFVRFLTKRGIMCYEE